MSDDDSDIDFANVKNMTEYEAEVVNSLESNDKDKETSEDLESKMDKVQHLLSQARINGKKKDIEKYEKELENVKAKMQLPEKIDVDLGLSITKRDDDEQKMPSGEDELGKYWHYKVMNKGFVGDDKIDLTIDDSDLDVYNSRNSYIRDFCEPYIEMHDIDDDIHLPKALWDSLFPHQKVALEWLTDLWKKGAGGIEGDEMGLGKTAIVSTFFHALYVSGKLKKPILVICPLTVAQQWIRELHIWCPQMHAILLHSTRANQKITIDEIISSVEETNSIIVTNYEFLQHTKDTMPLHVIDWSIVVCDEGHKIRNYQSSISRLVKKIMADFRLAVSGSPIQNNLLELWSLFDFAIPGLLGTLEIFQRDFADPIKIGGYANSSPANVFRAYKAAVTLRDLIKPYLLRRLKKNVAADLPSKSEQIFFVKLNEIQETIYRNFLNSSTCREILRGKAEFFVGIDYLRKICNHPALADKCSVDIHNSSKLTLLEKLLPQWEKNNHRVLLFSQYLKMLDFVELLLKSLNLSYYRIDGDTQASQRIKTMDKFNSGKRFACILSTKVGGVGVNLIGADRVIIIDPDWNPSTDSQALERAWRIGQKKPVSVFRLITIGTIEEKMYKKQIFKQFLSNKILQSPNQRRMFKPQTIKDMFTLNMTGITADDLSDDQDENNEEQKDEKEKEMVQTLCEDGDIQKVFNHDGLFDGEETPEKIIAYHKADEDNKIALKRLQKNGVPNSEASNLISRIKNDESNEGITLELKDKIINYFKANNGVSTTDAFISFFKTDPQAVKYESTVKHILRRVSILNKRTHTWHLIHRFK